MLLILFTQRTDYDCNTGIYYKKMQKWLFHHNISYNFQEIGKKLFNCCYQLLFKKFIQQIVVTNTVMYWFTTQENGEDKTMRIFRNSVYVWILYILNYHMKIQTRRNKLL